MPIDDDNEDIANLILGFFALLLLGRAIQNFPQVVEEYFGVSAESVKNFFLTFTETDVYAALMTSAVAFSAACLVGAVYAFIQLNRVRVAEKRELDRLTHAAISGEDTDNERWQQVLSYAASDDEELWRLAVIEADAMLDDMLEQAGYPQEQLGEKLRSVERSDFQTIEQAWEAHKLRNVLAHEGSNYDLTEREVQEAIDNYREIFKEFGYI